MTANSSLFISAPGRTARRLAEEILETLGVSHGLIAHAEYRTAATESREFQIPHGTDYHGYREGQGLPVWLRVGVLDENYRAQVLADYEGYPQIREAMFGATHLARMVHSFDNATERKVKSAVATLVQRYPLRWMGDIADAEDG